MKWPRECYQQIEYLLMLVWVGGFWPTHKKTPDSREAGREL